MVTPQDGYGAIFFVYLLIFVLVLLLVLYIYTSICLYFIAKKTNTENPWMAFIPFANIFLMAFIARKHWAYALTALLISMIPFVGGFISLGIMIYLWWKISEQRNIHGAWSLTILILPLGLIYMGYLAFKK